MKESLRIGVSGQLSRNVGPGLTITLGRHKSGDGEATVFSTPAMIDLMEHAARESLRAHLDDGEESVGVDVQINHTSATPPRTEVTAEARVTKVDKNVISFEVTARDPWGEIGRGTHRRAVIKTAKFARQLAEQKPVSGPASPHQSQAPHPSRPPQQSRPPGQLPSSSTIVLQRSGNVLHCTLDRPEKRNAINEQMTDDMERMIEFLAGAASLVRVVIVSGSSHSFCGGDDVGDLSDQPQAARLLSQRRGDLYRRITSLPQVFIAAVDGLALGGGLVLAAACDLRVATHRAKFGLPEVSLGWPPNYGMGIVQSLIGRGRTMELALTGESIDARRAESIGLISQVVSPSQLDSQTGRLAERLAQLPPEASQSAKRLLEPGAQWSDERAADAFVECLKTDTAQKSIARFRH